MIQSLYYPISPYAFSILEPSVLGDIYELFLVEKIKIQETHLWYNSQTGEATTLNKFVTLSK